jgi:hypothetical protein
VNTPPKRPDMVGLPLLREAMMALPPTRRRKVIALTQAAWFDNGLKGEIKRVADEKRLTEPLLQMAQARNQHLESPHHTIKEWGSDDAEWKAKLVGLRNQTIAILLDILVEIRALNVNLTSCIAAANGKHKA